MLRGPRTALGRGAAAVVATFLLVPGTASGGVYAANACVSKKQGAAASACLKLLGAWSTWVNDPSKDPGDTKLNAGIAAAEEKLAAAWAKAEEATARKAIDCADTTLASDEAKSRINTAVGDIVSAMTAGADLNDKAEGGCRAKLLKAAATHCAELLKAESKLIKSLAKDPLGAKRDAAVAKAGEKFDAAWAKATCDPATTAEAVATRIESLTDEIVDATTVSPNVPDTWTMITPAMEVPYGRTTLKPICSRGTPYVYFVKRGTVNKLLVYYQGGGACWDYLTCILVPQNKQAAGPGDNPASATSGFADLTNPANPFRDWHAVYVPYCTGDVHWGDATVTYTSGDDSGTIEHRGFVNAQVAEKWMREHFLNPTDVFVTGSSAGAYGAILHAAYLQENVYPAAQFHVLGDAGNGVITQRFLEENIQRWGILATLPKWIPALSKPITELSIDQLWTAAAAQYPRAQFAQYTTAWDGGGGSQIHFYNVMVFADDVSKWLSWWLSACEWHDKMRGLCLAAAAGAPNYRYYIGAGSRHTVWGSNKVYTDTTGGVPPLVDWINAMLAKSAAWTNVECTNCDLLPGDPRPDPLAAPFGPDGVVSCP